MPRKWRSYSGWGKCEEETRRISTNQIVQRSLEVTERIKTLLSCKHHIKLKLRIMIGRSAEFRDILYKRNINYYVVSRKLNESAQSLKTLGTDTI